MSDDLRKGELEDHFKLYNDFKIQYLKNDKVVIKSQYYARLILGGKK